jgi:large subunit ribosomal protein L4
VESTALVVDGSAENRNLELSSRNLAGVELVRGNQVHPYHLLRYDRAIFSRPALEKLQDSLKKSVSKRRHEEVA